MSYWNQFDKNEINSMHGIDDDEDLNTDEFIEDLDTELDLDEEDTNLCAKCQNGCNYCLMVGY